MNKLNILQNFSKLNSRWFTPISARFYSTAKDLTLVVEKDGVRDIKLSHDKTRNALSMEMMESILQSITQNQDDPALRCITLSAEGHVWSAGHNLKELTAEKGSEFHKQVFAKCSELIMAILQSPVPVIAKVDGLAAAAGCQLVASCDLIVCSDKSTFSTPGASFGIFCSTPGVAIARSMPRPAAAYMLLTGLPITAQEAQATGLVSRVVPAEQLDQETEKICTAIKSKSRSVIQLGKKFFYEQLALDVKTAYARGESVMVKNLSLPDGQEGIKSFVEKRKPKWQN